jgi:hypothetical protein
MMLGMLWHCNGREKLLCAQLATIPFVGWAKAAACVALIATKCGLDPRCFYCYEITHKL